MGLKDLLNTDSKSYMLDRSALEEVLLADNVRKNKVVVITLMGEARTAKSIFMNGMLAFLQKKDGIKKLSNADMYLETGREVTNAPTLKAWGDPVTKEIDGEKVAVILLLAQVAILDEEELNPTWTILALASFMSSMTILNVRETIKNGDLKRLKDIIEWNELVSQEQRFMIALRKYEGERQIGEGQEHFRDRLEHTDDDTEEVRKEKDLLSRKQIGCYLFPKSNAVRDPNKRPDLEPAFLEQMTNFVKTELADDKLKMKKSNNAFLTGEDLFELSMELSRALIEQEPNLEDLKKVVDQARILLECGKTYKRILGKAIPDLTNRKQLEKLHTEGQAAAEAQARRMCAGEAEVEVVERLRNKNNDIYEKFVEEGKKIKKIVTELELSTLMPYPGQYDDGIPVQEHDDIYESPTPSVTGDDQPGTSRNGPTLRSNKRRRM